MPISSQAYQIGFKFSVMSYNVYYSWSVSEIIMNYIFYINKLWFDSQKPIQLTKKQDSKVFGSRVYNELWDDSSLFPNLNEGRDALVQVTLTVSS